MRTELNYLHIRILDDIREYTASGFKKIEEGAGTVNAQMVCGAVSAILHTLLYRNNLDGISEELELLDELTRY